MPVLVHDGRPECKEGHEARVGHVHELEVGSRCLLFVSDFHNEESPSKQVNSPLRAVDIADLLCAAGRTEVVHVFRFHTVHLSEGFRLNSAETWSIFVDRAGPVVLVEVLTPTVIQRQGLVQPKLIRVWQVLWR